MERLTDPAWRERLPWETCVRPSVCHDRCINDKGAVCMIERVVSRLAQYEDSGLSCEEVAELAALKAAGRIIIRPCSVGDTVYYIRTRYTVSGYLKSKKYDYSIVTYPKCLIEDPDSCYVAEKKCSQTDFHYLGKTVFMTREEAEKRLEEAKARKNGVGVK